MRRKVKVVIDTNIFISALLGSKTCKYIYTEWLKNSFQIIISQYLLEEIKEVLKRTKLGLKKEEITWLAKLIERRTLKVEPQKKISVCRDKKDNMVLECALEGKVDFIITGDKDLLSISSLKGIKILSPSEFLKLIKS